MASSKDKTATAAATTEPTEAQQPAQEVATTDMFSSEALRGITSFEDAARMLYLNDIDIVEAGQVIGDGFALLKKDRKGILVGVPLLILEWNFYPGDYGDTFCAVRLVARNPDGSAGKYIINDGSTGIAAALKEYTERTGKTTGLMVRNGLRGSDYTFCDACERALKPGEADEKHRDDGKHSKATTYYLDTSM